MAQVVTENTLFVSRDINLITMTLYHVHHVSNTLSIGAALIEAGERVGKWIINPYATIGSHPYPAIGILEKRINITTAKTMSVGMTVIPFK